MFILPHDQALRFTIDIPHSNLTKNHKWYYKILSKHVRTVQYSVGWMMITTDWEVMRKTSVIGGNITLISVRDDMDLGQIHLDVVIRKFLYIAVISHSRQNLLLDRHRLYYWTHHLCCYIFILRRQSIRHYQQSSQRFCRYQSWATS